MNEQQFQSGLKESSPTEIAEGLPPTQTPGVDQTTDHLPNIRVKEPTFMEVFFAWEKLRLIYNALLIIVVLAMLLQAGSSPLTAVFFALHALAANLFFCAGPVGEGYLCWIGVSRQSSRWIVFCFGCVVAIALTVDSVPGVLKMLEHWWNK
jgi:hypothetical protein